jgi:hypothetical protein
MADLPIWNGSSLSSHRAVATCRAAAAVLSESGESPLRPELGIVQVPRLVASGRDSESTSLPVQLEVTIPGVSA